MSAEQVRLSLQDSLMRRIDGLCGAQDESSGTHGVLLEGHFPIRRTDAESDGG